MDRTGVSGPAGGPPTPPGPPLGVQAWGRSPPPGPGASLRHQVLIKVEGKPGPAQAAGAAPACEGLFPALPCSADAVPMAPAHVAAKVKIGEKGSLFICLIKRRLLQIHPSHLQPCPSKIKHNKYRKTESKGQARDYGQTRTAQAAAVSPPSPGKSLSPGPGAGETYSGEPRVLFHPALPRGADAKLYLFPTSPRTSPFSWRQEQAQHRAQRASETSGLCGAARPVGEKPRQPPPWKAL